MPARRTAVAGAGALLCGVALLGRMAAPSSGGTRNRGRALSPQRDGATPPPPPHTTLPPIIYVKVHKTGSKSMQKCLRVLEFRHGLTPLNVSQCMSGWPWDVEFGQPWGARPFPDCTKSPGPRRSLYDVIRDHAVFDYERMVEYLRPGRRPYVFVTLRSPNTHIVSSWDWYRQFDYWPFRSVDAWLDWTDSLEHVASLRHPSGPDALASDFSVDARSRNPQAHDLGWYQFNGHTTAADTNSTRIAEWLGVLDKQLDHAILLEQMDEGIALLAEGLGIELGELMRCALPSNPSKLERTQFTPEQHAKAARINRVDLALYAHFERRFNQMALPAYGPPSKLREQVARLEAYRRAVVQDRSPPPPPPPPTATAAIYAWTKTPFGSMVTRDVLAAGISALEHFTAPPSRPDAKSSPKPWAWG